MSLIYLANCSPGTAVIGQITSKMQSLGGAQGFVSENRAPQNVTIYNIIVHTKVAIFNRVIEIPYFWTGPKSHQVKFVALLLYLYYIPLYPPHCIPILSLAYICMLR